jgi:hypothetical protein
MAYENSTPAIWQQIKKYEETLERQMRRFTIQTDWSKYDNNRMQKDNLFNALVYVEKKYCDESNTPQQKKECKNTLLRPLVIAFIETTLKHDKDMLIEYFASENQQIYESYINFLKEQKENLRIKYERPIREC